MSSSAIYIALFVSVLIGTCYGHLGVDTSSLVSVGTYQCMRNNGLVFAIPRVFTQVGTCDQNGIQSIKNARAAGVSYVDGYIYPRTAMNPAQQIDAMLNCLNSAGAQFGMIWLDVEPDRMWSSNHQTNINFIMGLHNELDRRGVKHGIYTNANGWNQITGGWTGLSNLPLWWAYWDSSPSFSHWSPFGGWRSPAMKQYKGDTTLCGQSVDLNFW